MNRSLFSLVALAGLAVGSAASAGTLSGAMTTLNGVQQTVATPVKQTSAGQIVQVKHSFGVAYYGPDKNPAWTCYTKLEYSDGTAPEMIPVAYPAEGVARMRQYTKPGTYTATLTGAPHAGKPGCLGSATTKFTIENAVPAVPTPAASGGGKPGTGNGAAIGTSGVTPSGTLAAAQGMQPLTAKARVLSVSLRGGTEFTPGNILLYSTFAVEKADVNCYMTYSVAALGANGAISGPNLLQQNMGGNALTFVGSHSEFNPGSLDLSQGKYRVTLQARTDVPNEENGCGGRAHQDFEVKRKKIDFGN